MATATKKKKQPIGFTYTLYKSTPIYEKPKPSKPSKPKKQQPTGFVHRLPRQRGRRRRRH